MSQERFARLEKLYGELREAYALAARKYSETSRYGIAVSCLHGDIIILRMTPEEVDTVAKWKIEALEKELEALK